MSKIEKKIIKLMSDYPEQELYGQEIANKAGCSKASASMIMKSLVKKKMVYKKIKGRMRFYQINTKSPDVKRVRIDMVLEKINPLLPKLREVAQKIILFGSGSRGEQTIESDIDLFIMSREKNKARKVLQKISHDLPIKPIIKTPGEWSEMEIKDAELYYEIKNGIMLYDYVSRI